ncbi:dihydroneopterin aldolase [Alkalihalophilus pseudofirmus OF4]|uniref:7,8-dihydroneopterin aldolase n=1 Tax=Alkalihalophilus pseudofirmus (strain ATCC BAA-2126 / JCM 17055 / OF4) TaxID=398511 RepID=D3FR35_ALKPO|nr:MULTISPECIES: dihydroneopterin aldolase [Alkalihalophilus]ADC49731.1 dihydroneopterin aldolase [Alkalihalophilus pseudofirmus OF4]MED1603508.1 dihydroneopterin aldolase [Alkalihalophilus marmarensis]
MDKIYMDGLEFYGYHGVFKEENKLGQRFYVDLTLDLDLKKASASDNIDETINYGEVYKKVEEIVEGEPYKLVETVAEKIAADLLGSYQRLERCTVKLIKPDPPIPGHYKSVAVEITRGKNEA